MYNHIIMTTAYLMYTEINFSVLLQLLPFLEIDNKYTCSHVVLHKKFV